MARFERRKIGSIMAADIGKEYCTLCHGVLIGRPDYELPLRTSEVRCPACRRIYDRSMT